MVTTFQGNAVYQLLMHSDFMTKIILLMLLCASVICWTIFFYKLIMLSVRKRQLVHAFVQLKDARLLDDVRNAAMSFSKTMPGYLVGKQLSFLKGLLETKANHLLLTSDELVLLKERMEQVVDEIIYAQESYLSVLACSAAAAPLLGLLGTIWGLVHAFVSISERQQADIVTIAPGIAEALITTLAGLLVALPALIMFYYLHASIRHLEQRLYAVSDRVQWIVQTNFMQR